VSELQQAITEGKAMGGVMGMGGGRMFSEYRREVHPSVVCCQLSAFFCAYVLFRCLLYHIGCIKS
jgi:hypothetical protein